MDVFEKAKGILQKNRREISGHQYTVPSPDTYPYQWLWDSCFHAIILAQFEPEAAKAELRSLLSKQLQNGMVPHMIYWQDNSLHRYDWGTPGTSALTQPPMIAYAAWEIHRRRESTEFLREIYPSLMSYYRYLVRERDPHTHHLSSIINPDESGEDNSPRFDTVLKVPVDISPHDHLKRRLELVDANRVCNFDASECMRKHFWVKDVPFNAILVKNLLILSHIAALVGSEEDEHFASENAALVKEAMRERMFKDGVFYSTSGPEYEMLKVETWAHFVPLFAELYTQEEAHRVVRDHLKNTETFAAPHGVRTVSRREPSYRSAPEQDDVHEGGFWRGPVWIASHWFIYKGLCAYGFTAEAEDIRKKSIALIEGAGFREYFNPETGEGHGARDFTWGALILDMIEA